MNEQKKIEVNQSSLLSLKAELFRKKQEVHDAKLSEFPNKPTVLAKNKLKTKLDKVNEGVSEREKKDGEELDQERDILQKCQIVLEAKSKLYEDLVKNSKNFPNAGNFLVDFKNKGGNLIEKDKEKEECVVEESEEEICESDLDDDEEWVDFVDCLGRTKRCHRDDLEEMKARDEKLKVSLFGESRSQGKTPEKEEPKKQMYHTQEQLELMSEDMRREKLRQKWEEEEKKLLDRKDIHYQHVFFDEARSHGVGYYRFSTDEKERARQLQELKNLRNETLQQQAAAHEAADRKKKQMTQRLKAARRRKRERLGLPPEEESEDEAQEEKEKEEEKEMEEAEKAKPQLPRPAIFSVRPWDVGKEKTRGLLTQEEWVDRRRRDRPEEFAPPSEAGRKRRRPSAEFRPVDAAFAGRVEGEEVPPRPAFQYRGFCEGKISPTPLRPDIEKSVEEGLNFIRKQVEMKQAQLEGELVES